MTAGSLHNLLYDQAAAHEFVVGAGATVIHWTDRTACTVIEVSQSGKTIVLREDTARRTDGLGMTDAQSYVYEPNPMGRTFTARLTKNGYRIGGQRGNAVVPGRRHYYDFTF